MRTTLLLRYAPPGATLERLIRRRDRSSSRGGRPPPPDATLLPVTRHGPRCILGWLVLCSLACAAETPKSTPPPDLPDAAPADAGTGGVPGTPTLGCQTASDCSASDGRAVDCVAITSDFRACAIAPPAPATAATNERDE